METEGGGFWAFAVKKKGGKGTYYDKWKNTEKVVGDLTNIDEVGDLNF